jgi:SAM-dependent methyltransferase
MVGKFEQQAAQYEFPYHYIPYLDARGRPARVRRLWWGMEYLCYQLHALELVRQLRPAAVLEVGCGDGRFIGMLQDDVARCVGVDLVESAIRFASAFHPRVDFRCADLATVEEQFDVVATIEVLEHIPDEIVPSFVAGMCQRVRPGGHLLVCVPSDAEAVHPKHYRHYNEALLQKHVMAGGAALERVSMEHVYAPPWWWSALNRITCNKRATLEIPALNGVLWRHLWKRRRAAPGKGRHIVALYRRPPA